ncbi:NUDIX domain protein [Penicillium angulare]|uniref:NUDIX domain protein n=1 Tax=Penicillium angulare TaxID=116970 RepID=UPI00253F9693|nr:NUDIX domain protein [Penicillium angulare]KAJ5289193.1 NUDIX domain protein [Penicillium angulare]
MAPLNKTSLEAIERLRNYVPPPTAYGDLPLSRRAAVLLLLYADSKGDLRIVITIRAKTLSSFAGDAALPGGRADALSETPFQTARREAWEEIGLPGIDQLLPRPFTVEHLCELPASLARTELVVRPCVALLHAFNPETGENADPEVSLIPKLDAREVAAVFTAPFHNFLSMRDEEKNLEPESGSTSRSATTDHNHSHESEWYRVHQFFVRANNRVVKPSPRGKPEQQEAVDQLVAQEETGQVQRYRVFGMTARIIVDAARLAYQEEPEFEHNSHFGDERLIANLRRLGRLSENRRTSDQLTRETMEKASKLS